MNNTPDKPNYTDTFRVRADLHDEAFRLYPEACREEITRVLSLASVQPGETLLDLPSASGFLSHYLPSADIRLIAVDPSPDLHRLCAKVVPESHLAPLTQLPLANESIDVAVCLAGLHHEPRPDLVISEIKRVLKIGTGRAVVAEVDSRSAVAHFLNGFVNQFNSEGHQGDFVDETFVCMLEQSGLVVESDEVAAYHWWFDSRFYLGDCLKKMFGMDLASPLQIANAVEDLLGIDWREDEKIGMRWSLRTFLLRKVE